MSNIQTESVITEDKQRIVFDRYKSGHAKVIVIAHGFFNSRKAVLFKSMAESFAGEYDVLVMDFRGHGDSSGLFTWTAAEPLDLKAVLEAARRDYQRVGVLGYSLGAAVSLITASQTSLIDSLIAVSPPAEFGKIDFQFWKMDVMENIVYNIFQEGRIGKGVRPGHLWGKKIKPIDIIENIRVPVCFLCGQKDWLILPWHAEMLYQHCQSRKKLEIIDNGTHAEYIFRRDRDAAMRIFKGWFSQTL